jgi:hypothetical protein
MISLTILTMVCSISPAVADSWTGKEGNFTACYRDLYGFISRDGKTILKPTYWSIGNFHEDLATFHEEKRAGVVNKSGKVQVKATFEEIGPYINGQAVAQAYYPRKQDPKSGEWKCAGLWGFDRHPRKLAG